MLGKRIESPAGSVVRPAVVRRFTRKLASPSMPKIDEEDDGQPVVPEAAPKSRKRTLPLGAQASLQKKFSSVMSQSNDDQEEATLTAVRAPGKLSLMSTHQVKKFRPSHQPDHSTQSIFNDLQDIFTFVGSD